MTYSLNSHVTTLSRTTITHNQQRDLSLALRIMSLDHGVPADGILRRDNLWNRLVINAITKKITFFDGDKRKIIAFTLNFTNTCRYKCKRSCTETGNFTRDLFRRYSNESERRHSVCANFKQDFKIKG